MCVTLVDGVVSIVVGVIAAVGQAEVRLVAEHRVDERRHGLGDLPLAVVGAFIVGPWAFYRTLRGHDVPISDAAAIWWGFGIVVASVGITSVGFLLFLKAVGAY